MLSRSFLMRFSLRGLLPLASLVLAVSCALPVALAQDAKTPLPTAKEVLTAFVEATSTPELRAKQKSRTATGTMSIPSMQLSGPMKVFAAEPNLLLVDITIPGMGKSLQGFNGTIGWQIDPTRGPSLMEGDMLEQFMREADFHAEQNTAKHYDSVQVVGETEFNGQPCFELLFKKGDREETRFYNRKTHLLEGSKGNYPTPMGDLPVQTIISDYKTFEGFKVATKTTMQMTTVGIEQILVISTVSFNDVDPAVFELPPAIKALASAPKEQEEPKSE
jgi:hypothetical protein